MKMVSFFSTFPCNGTPVEWNLHGKTEILGEKPVPLPLCPPQIPHGLTRDRARPSAVRGRRLTSWAMARPRFGSSGMWCSMARASVPVGLQNRLERWHNLSSKFRVTRTRWRRVTFSNLPSVCFCHMLHVRSAVSVYFAHCKEHFWWSRCSRENFLSTIVLSKFWCPEGDLPCPLLANPTSQITSLVTVAALNTVRYICTICARFNYDSAFLHFSARYVYFGKICYEFYG
jgi:hypothetical protein